MCQDGAGVQQVLAIVKHEQQVAGFMIYELHKSRLHVLNFAVHEDHRRRGVGTQMLEKLVGKLTDDRRTRILLEVRERNLDAQLFFKAANFRAISDEKGRIMVLMTHNTDIADSWEREGEDREFFLQFSPNGYALGINVILYVLTH